jgi:serine/threonine protein kinase
MVGQTISRYRVLEKLGQGGMGVVYKAEDTKLDRLVALKLLSAHLLGVEDIRRRFEREAKSAAALSHSNVCHVYEIDEVDGETFIAMELIEGESLDQKISNSPLRIEEALSIAQQVAKGLEAAHKRGIVHRDIKPANIMVGEDGDVKILDFGLAQLTEASRLTKANETLGTVAYMSPEQTDASGTDHRSDIWSLGVALYEMATGQHPFKGDYDQAIMYSILNEEPEPVTALRTGVPMELERIVNKCLSKSAADRYQSAAELGVDLRGATSPRTPASGPVSRSRKRRPGTAIAAGLALLAAATAFWALRPASRAPQESWKISRVTSTNELEYNLSAAESSSLIAYSSNLEGNLEIYVMPLGGGKPLRLTDHPSDDSQPRIAPDGESLVFHSFRDAGLYTVPVTGGVPHRLTGVNYRHIEGILGSQSWRATPSGQELVFSRWEADGRAAIWKIDPASREETQISRPNEREEHTAASFSPDGATIVFNLEVGGRGGQVGLWTIPAEGGEPQPLAQDQFTNRMAAWTPDGGRVVFESTRSGARNLWELTLSSGDMRPITVGPGLDRRPLPVAGKGLFYQQFHHTINLYRRDLSSGVHESLTIGSEFEQVNPRFSSDGRKLAFDSNRGGDFEIVALDLENGDTALLTNNSEFDRYPDWSPVSDQLVFISTRSGSPALWLMDGAGGNSRLLDTGSAPPPQYSIMPHDAPGPPRWSRDGKAIAYVGLGESGTELWSVNPENGQAKRLIAPVYTFDWYGDDGTMIVYSRPGAGDKFDGAELRALKLDTREEVTLLEGLYGSLDAAPDGSAVTYVSQDGFLGQQYFLLPLTPPNASDGLPQAAGEPELLTPTDGWHTHAGAFSPDGSSFVYDRDYDEGDILLIENYQ